MGDPSAISSSQEVTLPKTKPVASIVTFFSARGSRYEFVFVLSFSPKSDRNVKINATLTCKRIPSHTNAHTLPPEPHQEAPWLQILFPTRVLAGV